MRALGAIASLIVLAGCGDNGAGAPDAAAPPLTRPAGLDVLFVVDDSEGAGALQDQLIDGFARWTSVLDALAGARPDLHVGVVTTSLAGPAGDPGCNRPGSGQLVRIAGGAGCTAPPAEPFLIDVAGPGGTRVSNVGSSLPAAFGCLAAVGESGCAFTQPLAAALAALDPANRANAGFRRPDAALAVIVVTAHDDCSVVDPALYDLAGGAARRCFADGVVCAPDRPDQAGLKDACRPRPDSHQLAPDDGAAALRRLAPAGWVHLAVHAGPPAPVEVLAGSLAPAPSCRVSELAAAPAVRLAATVDALGGDAARATACAGPDDLLDGVAAWYAGLRGR